MASGYKVLSIAVELHTVTHLKGLVNGKNIAGWQEYGSTFT